MIPGWEIKILHASWCSQKRNHPNWEKQRNQKTRQKKVGVRGAAAVSIVTFSVRWVSAPNMGEPVRQKSTIQLCAVSEGHLRVGDKSRLKVKEEDFVGGPVGRIPYFQCKGHRFDPWSWN